MVLTPNL